MARGPDGSTFPDEISCEAEGFNRMEFELTVGLEQVIDGAIRDYRGTGPFAYGVQQALSPKMKDVLARRYRAAGWSDVRISGGATGASVFVLHRD